MRRVNPPPPEAPPPLLRSSACLMRQGMFGAIVCGFGEGGSGVVEGE